MEFNDGSRPDGAESVAEARVVAHDGARFRPAILIGTQLINLITRRAICTIHHCSHEARRATNGSSAARISRGEPPHKGFVRRKRRRVKIIRAVVPPFVSPLDPAAGRNASGRRVIFAKRTLPRSRCSGTRDDRISISIDTR